jgi:hypothetical protein
VKKLSDMPKGYEPILVSDGMIELDGYKVFPNPNAVRFIDEAQNIYIASAADLPDEAYARYFFLSENADGFRWDAPFSPFLGL